MIPLRTLQVVGDSASPESLATEVLAEALRQAGQTVAVLAPGDGRQDNEHLITWHPGRWAWWRGGRRTLAKRVARWMPDLLHVHAVGMLGMALDLARDLRLPVVATMPGGGDPLSVRRLHDPLVSLVVTPTEHHRAHAIGRLGLERDRVAVLPPAVPVVEPRAPLSDDQHWRIGAVSFSADPLGDGGLHRFLKAVAAIQGGALPIAASVLVHSALAAKVASAASAIGADVAVIPGTQLGPFQATIDAQAFPAASEPHPFLLLSAMGRALPIVAVATGAVPELVRDGQTALLIPADGEEALADALRSLHNHTRRRTFGLAGASLASSRYAPALVAEAADAMYRSAIGGGDEETAEATRAWRRITGRR